MSERCNRFFISGYKVVNRSRISHCTFQFDEKTQLWFSECMLAANFRPFGVIPATVSSTLAITLRHDDWKTEAKAKQAVCEILNN